MALRLQLDVELVRERESGRVSPRRAASSSAIPMSFTKWSTKKPGAKSPSTMRGARFDNAQLAAAPLETEVRTDGTSRPARDA